MIKSKIQVGKSAIGYNLFAWFAHFNHSITHHLNRREMRYFFTLFITLLSQFLLAQNDTIYLTNASFEGTPGAGILNGKMPEGWYDCGFPGESMPDVHPAPGEGVFGVKKPAYDGKTYIGLVVRENETYERVGQRLSAPMKAGVEYAFSIYLCRSEVYMSLSRTSNMEVNYAQAIKLRIWGGEGYCDRKELLGESKLVIDKQWLRYDFIFRPKINVKYITFEAYYKEPTPSPYNGNLLMDKASAIAPTGNTFDASLSNIDGKNVQTGINANSDNEKSNIETSNFADLKRFEYTRPLMGTEFKIIIYHTDEAVAKKAADKAFIRVAVLEKVFSDYDENSEISWLSDAGKATDISDELWTVLTYAQEVAERSEGAFDVSVGALSKLWRKAFREKEFPSKAAINKALGTVGYQSISMRERNNAVKLYKEGMRLDFGGIAAGYAVDEAIAWLKVSGINMYLVDGGGDIRCGMAPPGKPGWEIEVPDKLVNGELTFKKAFYKNTAITTSGDTYRYLEYEGKRYSHIIDPHTGYGLTNRRIVTVTAPTCMEADAWATAACVGIKKLLTVDLRDKENIRVSILEE